MNDDDTGFDIKVRRVGDGYTIYLTTDNGFPRSSPGSVLIHYGQVATGVQDLSFQAHSMVLQGIEHVTPEPEVSMVTPQRCSTLCGNPRAEGFDWCQRGDCESPLR